MTMPDSIYDIAVRSLRGEPIDLSKFKGKKLLFVNVASACGYTYQYKQLEELYQAYSDKLIIIGCPCNDFGAQEPGSADDISNFCTVNFGVTFPLTEKMCIEKDTHPLYQWLTKKELNGISDISIRWNFHKILVNADGTLHSGQSSATDPLSDEIVKWIND